MVNLIIEKHGQKKWGVYIAEPYAGTYLSGRRLEFYPTLKEAKEFTKDIGGKLLKVI